MMCWFRRHKWLLIDRLVAPPSTTVQIGALANRRLIEMFERAALGCTTLAFQCERCRAIRIEHALGRSVQTVEGVEDHA